MGDPRGPAPLDLALEELERGRRDRWLVAAVLGLALAAAVVLLVFEAPGPSAVVWGVLGLVAVGIGYGAIVAVQERRAGRAIRALVAERSRSAVLVARATALEAAGDATRDVAAADELTEVFDRTLAAARSLTGARTGTVWLRVGDTLTVATAEGPGAPAPGTSVDAEEGPAGEAASTARPVQAGRGGPWGGGAGPSLVAAPMTLPDRVVGVLVLERGEDAPTFTAAERDAIALLADHAALALRATSRLERQREAAEQRADRERARRDELVGFAHDLKTPLASASGYVQLLQEREDAFTPERRNAVLRDARGELARLAALIDGMLQLARTERGEERPHAPVDLSEIAREVHRTARGLSHAQREPRVVELDAPEPAPVRGDASALHRVVANLVDNAFAHSPPGSAVLLAVRRDRDDVELTVHDDGEGIDAALASEAFEPFVRDARGGVGLGLHIVRTLVERHGGQVELAPAAEGGTRATVRLPRAADP